MLLISSLKKKTKLIAITSLDSPKDFYIPLEGYRYSMGLVVEVGDHLKKYELVAESEGVFPSKIHAPVSGVVKGTVSINGLLMLHIENDFKETALPLSPLDLRELSLSDLTDHLLDRGVQGAGGSQFPTHLKYQVESKRINTLIFNGVECEPFLSADFVLMKERYLELLRMAMLLASVLMVNRVVFAIEKQHKELRKVLLKCASGLGMELEVRLVPNSYPQGGELQLIENVTSMKIRKGSVPSDYGVLVTNIGTLWAMYNAVFEGKPYIERVVTVSGNSCSHLGNFLVRVGTPVGHVLNQTKNSCDLASQTVVIGGAMMGKAVDSLDSPIHKGAGGILVLKKNRVLVNNCIKCGLCVDVCPQHLMPLEFVRHNIANNIEGLNSFNLQDCIECGACAYVCPSDVPLMENIFDGKSKLF